MSMRSNQKRFEDLVGVIFAPKITHVLAGKREGRGADRDAAEAVLEQRAQVEVRVQVRVDLAAQEAHWLRGLGG